METHTEEFPLNKKIQQKILAALPGDSDIALNNLLVVLSYITDEFYGKVDRTVWSDSNKHSAGYRITIEPQMVLKEKK